MAFQMYMCYKQDVNAMLMEQEQWEKNGLPRPTLVEMLRKMYNRLEGKIGCNVIYGLMCSVIKKPKVSDFWGDEKDSENYIVINLDLYAPLAKYVVSPENLGQSHIPPGEFSRVGIMKPLHVTVAESDYDGDNETDESDMETGEDSGNSDTESIDSISEYGAMIEEGQNRESNGIFSSDSDSESAVSLFSSSNTTPMASEDESPSFNTTPMASEDEDPQIPDGDYPPLPEDDSDWYRGEWTPAHTSSSDSSSVSDVPLPPALPPNDSSAAA